MPNTTEPTPGPLPPGYQERVSKSMAIIMPEVERIWNVAGEFTAKQDRNIVFNNEKLTVLVREATVSEAEDYRRMTNVE